MIQRKTSLSENLIAFCRFLRNYGFIIGVQEQALALEALSVINFEEKENFKDALRITLVKNVQSLQKFDRLFDDYWKELEKSVDSKIKDSKTEYDNAMNKLVDGTGNLISRVEKLKKMGAKAKKSLPENILNRAEKDEQLFI